VPDLGNVGFIVASHIISPGVTGNAGSQFPPPSNIGKVVLAPLPAQQNPPEVSTIVVRQSGPAKAIVLIGE